MRKLAKQPIKVVDDFFESPLLWRAHALRQEFTTDETATWPGLRSQSLDEIDIKAFHSLASKLIKYTHGKTHFSFLKVNYALVDESYTMGWIHNDEPQYNVAGVIFLNPNPPKGTGLSFYSRVQESNQDWNAVFFDELKAKPEDRAGFKKYKEEQRRLFKKTMSVENIYNRCVMFAPQEYHAVDGYFGTDKETSRLAITFFGYAE